MSPPYEIVSQDSTHRVAHLGGLQIQLWQTRPSVGAARATAAAARRLSASGGEVGLLIVVEAQAQPPEGEARRMLTEVGTRLQHGVGCAFVSEARGFGAAAMRGVLTGMVLIARPAFPLRVFPSVDPALPWLQARSASFEPEAIARTVLALRAPP